MLGGLDLHFFRTMLGWISFDALVNLLVLLVILAGFQLAISGLIFARHGTVLNVSVSSGLYALMAPGMAVREGQSVVSDVRSNRCSMMVRTVTLGMGAGRLFS